MGGAFGEGHAQVIAACGGSAAGGAGIAPVFGAKNPFGFMELQDVELTNFFERRVSAYQVSVKGEVAFHDDF